VGTMQRGHVSSQGWNWDEAHNPEPTSIEYTLTGDFWYLEETWFWAGYYPVADFSGAEYWRGPTGAEGILWHDQIRSEAWELRDFVETAFISPDGTQEQSYFTQLINDAISCEEGTRSITTTANHGNAVWTWCNTNGYVDDVYSGWPLEPAGTLPSLHFWVGGSVGMANDAANSGMCEPNVANPCAHNVMGAEQGFETSYILYSLGRAADLGYPAGALLAWAGSLYVGMLTDPGFNPYMTPFYEIATVDYTGAYYNSFASLKTAYQSWYQNLTQFGTYGSIDGYAEYLVAAASYLTGLTNGQAAWNFVRSNASWADFSTLPKWAVTPRGVPTTPVSSCDLNQDGSVDASDVQSAINQALGTAACTGDLVATGTCNVVDVQRVINAALGGICRLGP
jgi:hypothetical protein